MNIIEELKLKIKEACQTLGVEVNLNDVIIEHSKDAEHGDYATNAAMKFSRLFQKSPRDVANLIVANIDKSGIEKIEIAGPGFINFFIEHQSLQSVIKSVINDANNYGCGNKKNFKINVEFVSANPTGNLHVGHARGAAIGDSICRILSFAGFDVVREYYINDAGMQITHLAESIEARYKEALGLPFSLPEDGYHGEDVKEVAQIILKEDGPHLLQKDNYLEFFKKRGIELEFKNILRDLDKFGVHFDVFSSELEIRKDGAVEKEIEYLRPHIYNDGDALVLRTTDFVDDKDRVIVKSNGDYTYFMPDIVYNLNKASRGFDELICVLGADHHGYINRMKSALMMHGYSKDYYQVELIQMVRFMKNGEEFKASKRSGDSITLKDIYEEVGVDAMRYFFAMRAASGHLDFDMDLAIEQSSSNPVYYAQYAHARLCSILEQGKDIQIDLDGKNLNKQSEINLLKHLAKFGAVVQDAAQERAPYKITNYIHELAELIHLFYTECRVINREDIDVSSSRLALCLAAKQVMKNALNLVGVSAPTHM